MEEARYNAALELAIEEDNDKAGYIQNPEKEDDEDHYDLAMEEPATEPNNVLEDNPLLQNIHVPETPKASASPASSTDPFTPTKSRNPPPFEPDVTIDSPKNLHGLKRPAADSPSSFGQLFLSRKSAKVDPLDHKFSQAQSDHIK